ncbi:hypothetical protein ACO22_08081 [Paracoccidioides brasiliensis]|uniref:Uncharacterized protein n=1 Tax=Paracoccidioides brasiliensis TaxID=121759 RepID=A0A1D2J2V2_PARBR|nr:hypothetical protein ACO22_08081 [Paracoccidioides brasiliensis]
MEASLAALCQEFKIKLFVNQAAIRDLIAQFFYIYLNLDSSI